MVRVAAISTPIWVSSPTKSRAPKTNFTERFPQNPVVVPFQAFPFLSAVQHYKAPTHFSLKAAAASSSGPVYNLCGLLKKKKFLEPLKQSNLHIKSLDYTEEPATNVKFQKSLKVPGCSSSLFLLGTGYREKVFAIIGVKVYAAGLYVDLSILNKLNAGKGKSAAEIQGDASIFDLIFQATMEKTLQIVLVRDVDGKTFWGALDDAISPRIKSPTPDDESALSTFRSIFQGRSLEKGTFIFLTWLDPTKMLVSVSSTGMPSGVDATIESKNVTLALFDVFFGSEPVSPSLKASVVTGLATAIK